MPFAQDKENSRKEKGFVRSDKSIAAAPQSGRIRKVTAKSENLLLPREKLG
jgi:hypothetical protein